MSTQAAVEQTGMRAGGHEAHYDPAGARIGMWLFLLSEIFLFGMMFLAYAVYLREYQAEFMRVSNHLGKMQGAVNTVVLLTSSLTMALAIAALQRGRKRASLALLGGTLGLAGVFLVIKAGEWGEKFSHGLYPNADAMLVKPRGEQVFYGLYYGMTGLHAVHVVLGMLAIFAALVLVWRNKVTADRSVFLENTGLYWHLVDAIWIFLFPLFYLIG